MRAALPSAEPAQPTQDGGGAPSPQRGLARRVAAALLLCLGVASLNALAATVSASLDRNTIGLGDSAALTITVEGGSPDGPPRFADVPGLNFSGPSLGSRIEIINFRRREFSEYTYGVSGSRPGTYEIGPFSIDVNGRTYEAPAVQLAIAKVDNPAAFIELNLPDRPVYVGESFVAEIALFAVSGSRLRQVPQLQADGFVIGEMKEGRQETNIRTNGRVYVRAPLLVPVTAVRTGELEVQAVNCVVDVPVARRRGPADFFDSSFFGFNETRRFQLASDPVKVQVRPLPRDNVPPGFAGAVGEFEVNLTASPTNVQAGDPITVRVEVTGQGNFDSVQLPDQPGWRDFRIYPANSTFEPSDRWMLTGTKRFEQVVTPQSPAITELPPLVFAFFSPEEQAYKTLETPAIPLTVAPGEKTPSLAVARDDAEDTTMTAPDIAPLKPHLGRIAIATPAWGTQPWFLALTALPWILWGSLRAWLRFRERSGADRETRLRRQQEKRIESGLAQLRESARDGNSEAFFAALFRVLQEIVSARTGQPPASITEGVLDAQLTGRGVPPHVVTQLHQLFQACNDARYAGRGAPADLQRLLQETESVHAEMRRSR